MHFEELKVLDKLIISNEWKPVEPRHAEASDKYLIGE